MSKYALTGPPFQFGGNLSETQRDAFYEWINTTKTSLPLVQQFHQIRAQQLRKSAGMLETYYAAQATALAPTFEKSAWVPTIPHYAYQQRNDHAPAMTVAALKKVFSTAITHMDDSVFHMNAIRCSIERYEDRAQAASEGTAQANALMAKLTTLFGQPEFQAVLVQDKTDQYEGSARFRTHQLDDPTPWEQTTRVGMSPA
jgi:hypothetical protein